MIKEQALVLFALLISSPGFADEQKLIERLDLSTTAFSELMQSKDSSIPKEMLQKSEAIVIFPRTLNIAWGIGGQYGKGVLLKHDKAAGRWSKPVFYMIGGITLGPQIGGQAVDIVLVIMNEKGLNSLLKSQSTLGGDAGIALGPVGRNAAASTDLRAGAEIYSYSRAKGLYIGLSLKGAIVKPDKDANAEYYGSERPFHKKLLEVVYHYAPPKKMDVTPLMWIAAALIAAVVIAYIFR